MLCVFCNVRRLHQHVAARDYYIFFKKIKIIIIIIIIKDFSDVDALMLHKETNLLYHQIDSHTYRLYIRYLQSKLEKL